MSPGGGVTPPHWHGFCSSGGSLAQENLAVRCPAGTHHGSTGCGKLWESPFWEKRGHASRHAEARVPGSGEPPAAGIQPPSGHSLVGGCSFGTVAGGHPSGAFVKHPPGTWCLVGGSPHGHNRWWVLPRRHTPRYAASRGTQIPQRPDHGHSAQPANPPGSRTG